MPVLLPPLSRRRFLGQLGITSAGALLGPEAFAARRPTDENSWALLSDIHIAADRTKVARGINMAGHLETVTAEILALPQRPAGVFVNGDLAFNSGESGDYGVVGELLRPIREDRTPIYLAMGNHDNRERFWTAFRTENTAKKPVTGRQTALIRTPRVNWFVLDSLEATLLTPGLIGPEQLTWLAKALDENARKPAVVLVHHNPTVGEKIILKDTGAFLNVIRPRKQVKAYMFGHSHKWETRRDESGIHFINLPTVGYVFQEGDPAGWVMANVTAHGIQLELRCVDRTHKQHGQTLDLEWRA